MGLTSNDLRFVMNAHARGVRFRRAATIGRQQLFIEPKARAALLARYGYDATPPNASDFLSDETLYAESLLRLLGAEEVSSFDASAYEGATDVHDLNLPLPESCRSRFDVVLESGSLEHIFDVRTALANCMAMVAADGHLIAISPANNFFGHGFYQFSPEFFYRAFSEDNGFKLELLALYEDGNDPRWYEIPDPRSLGRRLTFANCRPTYLALLARRISSAKPLSTVPQESDYAELWDDPTLTVAERTMQGHRSSPMRSRMERPLRRMLSLQDELRSRRHMKRLGLRPLVMP
jgi:SAM-dependent methyltransferase